MFAWLISVQSRKLLVTAIGIAVSVLTDSQLTWDGFHRIFPGYGSLVLHAAASAGFEHTLQVLAPAVGTRFAIAASVLGASAFALPLYVFRMVVVRVHIASDCPELTLPSSTSPQPLSFPSSR